MSERTVKHFLDDILHAIEDVERFVAQMDFESFTVNEKTIRATEREFEITCSCGVCLRCYSWGPRRDPGAVCQRGNGQGRRD